MCWRSLWVYWRKWFDFIIFDTKANDSVDKVDYLEDKINQIVEES